MSGLHAKAACPERCMHGAAVERGLLAAAPLLDSITLSEKVLEVLVAYTFLCSLIQDVSVYTVTSELQHGMSLNPT